MPLFNSVFAHLMGIFQAQTCPSCGYFFSGISSANPAFGIKAASSPYASFVDEILALMKPVLNAPKAFKSDSLMECLRLQTLAIHCLGAAKSIGSPNI